MQKITKLMGDVTDETDSLLKNGDVEGTVLKYGGWIFGTGCIAQTIVLIVVLVLSLQATNRSQFQYTSSYATYNFTTGSELVVLPTTVANYYSTYFFILPLIVSLGGIAFYASAFAVWNSNNVEGGSHAGEPTVYTSLNLLRLVAIPTSFTVLQYILGGNKNYGLAILSTAAPIGLVAIAHLVDSIANGVMFPNKGLEVAKEHLEPAVWFFGVFLGALFSVYTLIIGLVLPLNVSLSNKVSRTMFIDALYAMTVLDVIFVILGLIFGTVMILQELKEKKVPFKSSISMLHGFGHVSVNLLIFILGVWGVVEFNNWVTL